MRHAAERDGNYRSVLFTTITNQISLLERRDVQRPELAGRDEHWAAVRAVDREDDLGKQVVVRVGIEREPVRNLYLDQNIYRGIWHEND
jgi:hypothetical protein